MAAANVAPQFGAELKVNSSFNAEKLQLTDGSCDIGCFQAREHLGMIPPSPAAPTSDNSMGRS